MKTSRLALLILAIAIALYFLVPSLSWASMGLGRADQMRSPLTHDRPSNERMALDQPADLILQES
jgi:hypothetical protein